MSDTLDPVILPEPQTSAPVEAPPASVPAVTVAPVTATPTVANRGRVFTQEELDARVGEARAAGRKSAYSYLQKELGVPLVTETGDTTLDGLRSLVTQARTGETTASAQLRDLLARQQAAEQQLLEKESEVRGAYGRAQQMLRLGEAKALATQIGFVDPRDAVLMLGDLARFEADIEAGTVAGLTEALTELAGQKPYLLKGATAAAVETPPLPAPLPSTPRPADPRATAEEDEDSRREAVRRQASAFF